MLNHRLVFKLCIYFHLLLQGVCASFQSQHGFTIPSAGIVEQKLQLGASWGKKFCNWKLKLQESREESKWTNKNKIVGMATGSAYTFDKLVLFCKSVREVGFQGEVLIGVSKLKYSEEKKREKMFKKFGITGVYLDGVKGGEWGQSICRYYAYLELINAFSTSIDNILVSDVRDVFFQDDPFQSSPFGSQYFLKPNCSLLLFSEGLNDISLKGKATLRNTRGNFRWLRNIYGERKARILAQNTVLCSGTTIGTKSAMQYYTRAMLYEGYQCLRRNPSKYDGKRGHVCSGGADQGFHNFLFWNNLLVNSTALPNARGPVYTIGIFRGKPVRSLNFDRAADGKILSPSQRGAQHPVPIIHQWDRHADLLNYVFQKFDLDGEGVTKAAFRSHLLDGSFSGKVRSRSKRGI